MFFFFFLLLASSRPADAQEAADFFPEDKVPFATEASHLKNRLSFGKELLLLLPFSL